MNENSGLFTDLYQLTMAKSYLDSGLANQTAVFELFFRKCPFNGEYAVCSGHQLIKEFLSSIHFSDSDMEYLKSLPSFQSGSDEFFNFLKEFDLKDVEIYGVQEGGLIFPQVPVLQVRGPLIKLQLLETALLNAMNYASLVATYAQRIRQAAGPHAQLVEFGMRRAQGPNGAMTASRSAYVGGFDGTSNVLAAKAFGIPVVGTMAHAFVQSFSDQQATELKEVSNDGYSTHPGELSAFLSYAKSYPDACLLLVDTYDSLQSGIPNAIRVFKKLKTLGHRPLGIRLDSGDLVHLSKEGRRLLDEAGFPEAKIFVSNELSESIIQSLIQQDAKIDGYGVGTKLATCFDQPAFGGVYKLTEFNSLPRFKISEQTEKSTLPGAKQAFRFFGKDGKMLLDFLSLKSEKPPESGMSVNVFHPFDSLKKAQVEPLKIESLHKLLFSKGRWIDEESIQTARLRCQSQMSQLREDMKRSHFPTPYKVSVSKALQSLFHQMLEKESPPKKIS